MSNIQELTALFEEGDELTLGEFKSLGTEDDFFTKLNEWYYGALGQRAFTKEGQVPIKLPNDPLIQVTNAKNLYNRFINGDFGEEDDIIVQKWGSGGLLDPVVSFLDEISRLDQQNGTNVCRRMKYVISDISEKSVLESKTKAEEDERTKEYLDADVLQFEVFDASKAVTSGNITNIESSYLYDSMSQPIIAKVGGKFYELHCRAYIDGRLGNKFETNNYKRVNPHDFKRWLEENNLEKLSQVCPMTFGNIQWEVKLVEIDDLRQYPNGKILEEMMSGVDNVSLPTGETSLKSLRNAVANLRPNGYVQVFDLAITEGRALEERTGDIHQYNGSVFALVNFQLIAEALKDDGFEVKVEHLTDYLERILGERVIPTNCMSYCVRDSESFDKFFPMDFMRKHKWIVKAADKIKVCEGYSDQGRSMLYWKLKKEGLINWRKDNWLERDRDNQDYVADFRETLRSSMKWGAFAGDPMWIFEQSPNEDMSKMFEYFGLKSGIIDHLFEYHTEISDKLEYHQLSIQK